jgi:hypothetical protein
MKELWKQLSLSAIRPPPEAHGTGLVLDRGPFRFFPLASDRNHLYARLDILLFGPAPPGHLINHGGDLDNRLKTFLHALRAPDVSELPNGVASKGFPNPIDVHVGARIRLRLRCSPKPEHVRR